MKLEVTRGIECGERGYGDESGECGFRGEWNGGVECGSNRVKLRLNVEMRVSLVVVNVEMRVDMIMLKNSSAAIPHPPLSPSLHPIPNQSKPIVPPLILVFNLSLILVHYNL